MIYLPLSIPSLFNIPLNRILFIPNLVAHMVSPDVFCSLGIDRQMFLLTKVLLNGPDNLSVFLVENTLFLLRNFDTFGQSFGGRLLSRMRNHHGRHEWSILRGKTKLERVTPGMHNDAICAFLIQIVLREQLKVSLRRFVLVDVEILLVGRV